MDRIKLFIPLIIFILLAAFLLHGLNRDPAAMPSALLDKPVPAFVLPNLLADDPVTQAVFQGQVSLLNVWATWCQPCRAEHPYLMELAERGVPIVGLNYKDQGADARGWLADKGNPYSVVAADTAGQLGIDLGVFGAPETYLVDAQGVIRFKHVGILDERVWRKEIEPLYQSLTTRSRPLARGSD